MVEKNFRAYFSESQKKTCGTTSTDRCQGRCVHCWTGWEWVSYYKGKTTWGTVWVQKKDLALGLGRTVWRRGSASGWSLASVKQEQVLYFESPGPSRQGGQWSWSQIWVRWTEFAFSREIGPSKDKDPSQAHTLPTLQHQQQTAFVGVAEGIWECPQGRWWKIRFSRGQNRKLLLWFDSYVKGGKQRTSVEDVFSCWVKVATGVPQDSVMGPLFIH